MTKKLSLALLISCALTTHNYIHATKIADGSPFSIAYLPEKLKASIDLICDITDPDDLPDSLKNFFFILENDEKIGSRDTIKNATQDALILLKKAKDKFPNKSHFSIIAHYLQDYLNSLSDGSILNAITGKTGQFHAQQSDSNHEEFLDIIDNLIEGSEGTHLLLLDTRIVTKVR